jgi:uncharacterized membrane protein
MSETNPNARLEAFCDGVFAIALTLLVLEIRIPPSGTISTTNDLWFYLRQLLPSIFAFLLSFVIVFITWANHHATLKLVDKTSSRFIYANGFLLLTVVFMPFPTALIGEYVLTDYASPDVILYDSVLAFQAIGWILICNSAIKNHLGKNEKSTHEHPRLEPGRRQPPAHDPPPATR